MFLKLRNLANSKNKTFLLICCYNDTMKKTLVLGATDNPSRYAYLAVEKLLRYKHEVVPVGQKETEVLGLKIQRGQPAIENIDTVTLYLNPKNQEHYYNYILSLKPKRIIFNPGTENPVLENMAEEKGIETVEGCTLVMLSAGQY
jgi:predicted CoA-binding protein